MKWSITSQIGIVTVVIFILLSVIGANCYFRTSEQNTAGKLIVHAQQVISELNEEVTAEKDCEEAQRNYASTGGADFLQVYIDDLFRIDERAKQIAQLISDEKSEKKLIGILKEEIKRRLDFADQIVALSKSSDRDSARVLAASLADKNITKHFNDTISELEAEEMRLLKTRYLELETKGQNSDRAIETLIITTLGLLIFILLLVRHHEKSSELKFAGVFNQSFETIALLDTKGKLLQINDTGLNLAGIERNRVIGMPYWDTPWWHNLSDQQNRVKEAVKRAAQGEVSRFETQNLYANNSYIDIDFSLKPLRDNNNNITFLLAELHELTEFKRAQKAFKESEGRLSAIFASMDEGLCQLDPSGNLVYMNNAGTEMLGYELEEAIGRNMHDLVHGPALWIAKHTREACPILEVIKSKQSYQSRDDVFIRNDGSALAVGTSCSPLTIEGNIRGTVLSFGDITALKYAEKRSHVQYIVTRALAQSEFIEEAAGKILESIGDNLDWSVASMWMHDEQLDQLKFVQLWHNKSLTNINAFKRACHDTPLDQSCSYQNAFFENAPLWISRSQGQESPYFSRAAYECGFNTALAFPIRNEEKSIGVIELYSKDVRKPELELLKMLDNLGRQFGQFIERKRFEQRLKESEELFGQLADNIKEVFWVASPTLDKFLFLSPAYEEVWGLSRGDLYKNPAAYIRSVLKEDRRKVFDHVQPENLGATGSEIEFRMRQPDGNIRWIWSRAFPIKDKDGILLRLCGIAHDITERKEMEKRVSEFYSTVSHELRTPLTSIRAALGLIEGGLAGAITEKAAQLTRIARSESDRLIRLINDILDIRKIEAGKLELKKESIWPHELIEDTFNGVQAMASEARVALVKNILTEQPFLADRDRMVQVLTNLVSNAVKFSEANTEVKVTVSRLDHGLRFSVQDSGPGIPANQIHKLFGLFQQLDSSDSRPRGGTGLGLAISKAIVEQHGGTISVESTIGKGSTFWFDILEQQNQHHLVDFAQSAPNHKVLLVENDAQLSELLRALLETDGYEVSIATTSSGASKTIAQLAPKAVILDVQLPDGSGLDWMKKLRESPKTQYIPVIALSGRKSDLNSYGHPVLIDWLDKSYTEKQFLKTLRLSISGKPLKSAKVLLAGQDKLTNRLVKDRLNRLDIKHIEALSSKEAVDVAMAEKPDLIFLDLVLAQQNDSAIEQILSAQADIPLIVFANGSLSAEEIDQLTIDFAKHLVKSKTPERKFLATIRELLNRLLTNISD